MTISRFSNIGVVVIGRNEGERLVQCLQSLLTTTNAIIYVDSASTDNSVANASDLGIDVVNLDMQLPFTAARARNSGFNRLLALYPHVTYVQFVDGDCEVIDGWLSQAVDYLSSHEQTAIVCGRRMERYPDRSVYNFQCNLEWNTPVGETKACGGDFLARVTSFKSVGGFNDHLIAGEEPELCLRLRKAGWKIQRINADMTLHDAAILIFSQWWKRSKRAGHAFAEGAFLHGAAPERHYVKETRRAMIWGGVFPLIAIVALILKSTLVLLVLALYVTQWVRMYLRLSQTKFRSQLAFLIVTCKFPEFAGVCMFWKNRLLKKHARIIEYK